MNNSDLLLRCKRARTFFSGAIAIFLLPNRSTNERTQREWAVFGRINARSLNFDDTCLTTFELRPLFFSFYSPCSRGQTPHGTSWTDQESEGLSFSLAPGVVAVSSPKFLPSFFYICVNFWNQPKKVITRRIRVLFILLNRRIGDTYSR